MKLCVLSDLCLDITRYGLSTRTSPESESCVILNEVTRETTLGMGGNVAAWLGAVKDFAVTLATQDVSDRDARTFHRLCEKAKLQAFLPPMGILGATTIKERLCLVDEEMTWVQHLARVDRDPRKPLSRDERDAFLEHLSNNDYDGIVVADYGKGLFQERYGEHLKEELSHFFFSRNVRSVVNSKYPQGWANCFCDVFICNDREIKDAWPDLRAQQKLPFSHARHVIITCGDQGAYAFRKVGTGYSNGYHARALAMKAVDVCGAGDAFTAGVAYEIMRREAFFGPNAPEETVFDLDQLLVAASLWAAHCVGQVGCGIPIGG